jgi:hypothetical protein
MKVAESHPNHPALKQLHFSVVSRSGFAALLQPSRTFETDKFALQTPPTECHIWTERPFSVKRACTTSCARRSEAEYGWDNPWIDSLSELGENYEEHGTSSNTTFRVTSADVSRARTHSSGRLSRRSNSLLPRSQQVAATMADQVSVEHRRYLTGASDTPASPQNRQFVRLLIAMTDPSPRSLSSSDPFENQGDIIHGIPSIVSMSPSGIN